MLTIQRGLEAETAVIHAFVRLGVPVLLPWGEGHPYDLAVDVGGRLVRLQVKSGRVRGDVVRFNACSTDHGQGRRSYRGVAEAIAVHCPGRDDVWVVAVDGLASFAGTLRLRPARNNQRRGVRMAADCTVERWLEGLRCP